MYLGEYRVDEYVLLAVQLHRFSSGAEYAATGTPTYTVYENNSTNGPDGNPAAAANLANLASETGLWTARVQLTAAAGYEAGKDYIARIEATVDGVTAAEVHTWRVSNLGTVQTGDSYAIVNGDHGLVSIQDDVDSIKAQTDKLVFEAITNYVHILVKAQDNIDFGALQKASLSAATPALSAAGNQAVWDLASALTLDFGTLMERAYQIVNNKMNVTDATGAVSLRNIADSGTIATGSVTDDLTTTVRAGLTWA